MAETCPEPLQKEEKEEEDSESPSVTKTEVYHRVRNIMMSVPYRLLVGRNLVLFLNLVHGIRGPPEGAPKKSRAWRLWRKNLETQFLYGVAEVFDTTTKGSLQDLALLLVLKSNATPVEVHYILGSAVLSAYPDNILDLDPEEKAQAWMTAKCAW
jgi:DNA primase